MGDKPALAAAHIAARLGLRFHPPEAVEAAGNKYLARERLLLPPDCPVPAYFRVTLDCDVLTACARAPWPCVLKPLGLSASRGVIRADDPGALRPPSAGSATCWVRPICDACCDVEDRFIQVEDYHSRPRVRRRRADDGGRLASWRSSTSPIRWRARSSRRRIYVTPRASRRMTQQAIARRVAQAVRGARVCGTVRCTPKCG